MLSEDTEVWTKYLAGPVVPIKEVWYDVHVGQGLLLPLGSDDLDRRIARGVTRKRIDVVCNVGFGFWVVELKPYASMLALGQILSYSKMFDEEYQPEGQVWPVIISYEVDTDVISEFEALGVVVITV